MALDANKVTLAWPNRVNEATLTVEAPGAWEVNLPLDNLKNPLFAVKARSTNLTSVNFTATTPSARNIQCFGLANHNLSVTAQWRIRVYDLPTLDTLLYDSGFLDVWPPVYTTDDLEWEFDNFWEGTLLDEDRGLYTTLATHFSDDPYIARTVRIDIVDDNNTDGYVEIGRFFFAETWQPTINMNFGASLNLILNTNVEQALDGTEYFDRRTPKRNVTFTLGRLTEQEAMQRVYNLQRLLNRNGEILFAYNLQDTPWFFQRTFIGVLQETNPLTQPYINYYENSFNILEKI